MFDKVYLWCVVHNVPQSHVFVSFSLLNYRCSPRGGNVQVKLRSGEALFKVK